MHPRAFCFDEVIPRATRLVLRATLYNLLVLVCADQRARVHLGRELRGRAGLMFSSIKEWHRGLPNAERSFGTES